MQKKIIQTKGEFETWLKKKKETGTVLKTDLARNPLEYPCMIVWTTVGLSNSSIGRTTYYGFIYPKDTIWEQ